VIAPNAVITGNTTGARNDLRYQSSTICNQGNGETGPDLVYRVSVPPFTRLESTLRSSLPDGGSNWDSIFNVVVGSSGPGCGSAFIDGGFGGQACVSGADDPDDPTEVQRHVNGTASTQDLYLIVDGFSFSSLGDWGPFTLTTQSTPLPPGDVCGNAQPLTLPVNLPAEALGSTYQGDVLGGAGCATGTSSNDRIYTVNVPANSRLSVTVVATGFVPTINLARACGPSLTCVAGARALSGGGTVITAFDTGPTASTLFLVVDTSAAAPSATFSLAASVAPISLLPGDLCSNATAPVTTSTVLQNETFVGYQGQYDNAGQVACSYLPGVDRAYAVTVPPGQVLRASVTPSDAGVRSDGSAIDVSVSIVPPSSECHSGPCVAGVNGNFSPGGTEIAVHNNAGMMDENVMVVVDCDTSTVPVPYSLSLNLAPMMVGDICADPLNPITASVSFGAESLAGYANDYVGPVPTCAFGFQADRVYEIRIPSNHRLTVTANSTADLALNLVSTPWRYCAPVTSCLASADSNSAGTETVTFAAGPLVAESVYLIVDRFNTTGSPNYSLTIDLSPVNGYTESAITPACTTLTSPTALIASVGDDSTSAVTALPFPFTFFGSAVSHFGVTTNGNMQFFTTTSGTSVNQQWVNATIPAALEPNGLAAPFWDDLHTPLSGASPAIRSAVTGTAPNQVLTIEWFDLAIAGGGGGGAGTRTERLNFQAKLFQTSNVIEFHYCTLAAGTGTTAAVTGAGATVGLENGAGTIGVLHSFDTAGSVSTSAALRFTP